MQVSVIETCLACAGDGVNYVLSPKDGKCPKCRGTGTVPTELGEEVLSLIRTWLHEKMS